MAKKSRKRKKHLNKKQIILYAKISTVVIAICVAVILGFMIPRSMNDNSSGIIMTNEYKSGEDIANSLEKNAEIEALIQSSPTDEAIVIQEKVETEEEPIVSKDVETEAITQAQTIQTTEKEAQPQTIQTSEKETQIDAKSPTSNETDVAIIEDSTLAIPENLTEEERIQYVKDLWVDDMIQENIDEIDQAELSSGATIYNQLDTSYIFGLAENGMTDEEEAEVMQYLESNLTPDQIALAKTLFQKYIGLVN